MKDRPLRPPSPLPTPAVGIKPLTLPDLEGAKASSAGDVTGTS